MNLLYLVVCFINLFVFSVNAAPASTTSNIFDLIQSYSAKNCPALSKNILIDKNMSYLSRCRDVSLENMPASVEFVSMDEYLCVGILEADFRLCNALSNESYTELAKSYEDLRESISSGRKNLAAQVCTALKNFTVTTLNNSSDIGVKLAPWMSKFNEQLFGPGCTILCAEFGNKTNEFCSLLFYINAHVQNVQRVMQQRNLNTAASPKVSVKTTSVENMKSISAGSASVPLAKPQVNVAPAPQAHEAAKVQPKVQPQIKTTKTETTTESVPVTKPQADLAGGDKENKSQIQTKAVVGAEQDVDNKMAAKGPAPVPVAVGKEPVVNEVKPKEADQTEKENIEVKSPGVIVQNSAPETQNTAAENKFDTPETKEEATNTAAHTETTEKEDNGIFDTTIVTGLKEQKLDNYIDDDDELNSKLEDGPGLDREQESPVPVISDQSIAPREYADVEDSNFFAYFMFISVMFIAGYVLYHNKQKILALVLEGRRDRNARRRPNTASYRKLNSNLEEAVTSKCSGSAAHVIY